MYCKLNKKKMTSVLVSPRKLRKLSNGLLLDRLNIVKKSELLPRNWRKLLIADMPEFDTYQGSIQMDNTHKGIVINEVILNFMENTINQIK